ncbi:MAG: Wzz/FepE/Etk N-terminal domain-containing protein [Pyrinomonadaceae bacterium]
MAIEFRQRTPGEYAQLLWRRKWLIMLPALAVTVAVAWVVKQLPNVYESKTTLVVRPPTISPGLVPQQLSDEDLMIRINNIGQEALSRKSLEQLITTYDLYRNERERGEPMDKLIEQMQKKDVKVEVNRTNRDTPNSFDLAFRGQDPRMVQSVAAALARRYVDGQIVDSTNNATNTSAYFDEKLGNAKNELDAIDKKRLEFMQQNASHLPSDTPALIAQLNGLREQQKTLIIETGRLRDGRVALENQLSTLGKARADLVGDTIEQSSNPKNSQGYALLIQRKSQLEAEMQTMLTTLKPKNPDVIKKQAEIDSVQREMRQLVDDNKREVEAKRKEVLARIDPQAENFKTQLQLTAAELDREQKQIAQIESQIAQIESRLNQVPGAQVVLEGLESDIKSKKASYDELLKKQQNASIVKETTQRQQGVTIQVVDVANLPDSPVAPKRYLLMPLGLVAGLGFGFLLAAFFELPRLLTLQTTDDVRHYTELPVLVSMPEMLTTRELRRRRFSRTLMLTAGVIATIVSIPALAMLLKLSHIFDRFAA